jgi:hypothetical protein
LLHDSHVSREIQLCGKEDKTIRTSIQTMI